MMRADLLPLLRYAPHMLRAKDAHVLENPSIALDAFTDWPHLTQGMPLWDFLGYHQGTPSLAIFLYLCLHGFSRDAFLRLPLLDLSDHDFLKRYLLKIVHPRPVCANFPFAGTAFDSSRFGRIPLPGLNIGV